MATALFLFPSLPVSEGVSRVLHEVTLGHCFICGLFRLRGRSANPSLALCIAVSLQLRNNSDTSDGLPAKNIPVGKTSLDPSESRLGSVLKKRLSPCVHPSGGRKESGEKWTLGVRLWLDTDAGSPRTLTMPVEDDETGDAFS